MKASVGILLVTLTLIGAASRGASSADHAERIWILPFTQLQPDPDLEYLQDALPALLAVAVSGSGSHSIVEREALNLVLSEQSMTLEGLTSPESRQRVGKLLGATMMVSGSFARQGPRLHVTMRASDLGNGIVAATADGFGTVGQPGELVGSVYRRLAGDLAGRLPLRAFRQIDDAPLANLHFMKGLGHYHGARYSHSIAEFMRAEGDERLVDVSRLWRAKAYLALRQYSHACLELTRLKNGASTAVEARDVTASMRECERHLTGEDRRMIRDMAGRQERPAR
jgi:TolB-like protein